MLVNDGTGSMLTASLGEAKSGYCAFTGVCLIAARID